MVNKRFSTRISGRGAQALSGGHRRNGRDLRTKEILRARYGDKNRIIQSHLDYLDAMQPAQPDSPEELNVTYVECLRRIQALKALRENTDAYERVLAPKLLCAFPSDICCHWHVHAKREGIPESSITRLLEYLNEEVDGAINTQKIRGEAFPAPAFVPTAAAFQVSARPEPFPLILTSLGSRLVVRFPLPYFRPCGKFRIGPWS